LGVLASGRGSNLAALLEAIERGDLAATVAVVVSNNSRAGALQIARDAGIAARHVSSKTHPDEGAALHATLREYAVDVVALAGYMKQLDGRVIAAFEGRIVNMHPAPLPQFGGRGMYGAHVHAAVLAAGVAHSGPTVHRVTREYDEGEVLGHHPVAVQPGDTIETLAARVLQAEHDLYWRVLAERFTRPA
jgi:phosphoribosylglycinamide formyltransferase-1